MCSILSLFSVKINIRFPKNLTISIMNKIPAEEPLVFFPFFQKSAIALVAFPHLAVNKTNEQNEIPSLRLIHTRAAAVSRRRLIKSTRNNDIFINMASSEGFGGS